jgi:hypothetical protein
MFIRTKRIYKNKYAYLVENLWEKGTRQKVRKYLGRVFEFKPLREMDFFRHYNISEPGKYISGKGFKAVVCELAEFELIRHGFRRQENAIVNGRVVFEPETLRAIHGKTGKSAVIALNEGFLCKETLHSLINFRFDSDEKELGYRFARAFVDAGLIVPKELFVGVFEKYSFTTESQQGDS